MPGAVAAAASLVIWCQRRPRRRLCGCRCRLRRSFGRIAAAVADAFVAKELLLSPPPLWLCGCRRRRRRFWDKGCCRSCLCCHMAVSICRRCRHRAVASGNMAAAVAAVVVWLALSECASVTILLLALSLPPYGWCVVACASVAIWLPPSWSPLGPYGCHRRCRRRCLCGYMGAAVIAPSVATWLPPWPYDCHRRCRRCLCGYLCGAVTAASAAIWLPPWLYGCGPFGQLVPVVTATAACGCRRRWRFCSHMAAVVAAALIWSTPSPPPLLWLYGLCGHVAAIVAAAHMCVAVAAVSVAI